MGGFTKTCRRGHQWTPDNIKFNKRGHRQCRICLRAGQNRRGKERRASIKGLSEEKLIPKINMQARYYPRIEKLESGCWIWKGARDGAGYGYLIFSAKPISTHRIAYTLANGEIQKGLEICHRCDTPLCVNPDHLFAATHAENMEDMRGKGRGPDLNAPFGRTQTR